MERSIPYDVVIVGSGGGGLRAAISAAESGAKVLIVAKGKINRSGSTLLAGANLSADIACDGRSLYEMGLSEWNKDDSKDKFFEDVCHEGFYLGNQRLVRRFVDDAPDRIRELMDWGMEVLGLEGERGISVFGSAILDSLFRRVRELGIPYVENTVFTDLVVENGAVAGCTCVDLLSGDIRYIPAKAVVLATGGSHGIFRNNSGPSDCCGEGPAAALRAGAELIDMEMISFCPAVILYPEMYKGNILPYIMNTTGYGQFINKYGKTFTQRYLSPRVEALALDTEWNKMLLSYVMQKEINSRRCNRYGGVYYTLALSPQELREELYNDLPSLAKGIYGDIMEIFQTNVKGAENLLEGLRRHCPAGTRVVLTSTAGVYGNVPLSNIPETTPYSPMNYYGLSKVTMELLARRYGEFDIRILRPFNIIGAGQKENFLIPKLVRAFVSRLPVLKVGNLETVRDYTDVRFGSQVFVQMALRDVCSDKILNLCSGHGTSGEQIVEYLRQITGYSPEITVDKSFIRRGEIMRLVGDNSRLKAFMQDGIKPLHVKDILAEMVTALEQQTA